jgi:hypothetical protein
MYRVFLVILSAVLLDCPASAAVRINEIMAANDATISDRAGDYPDWIELLNTSDSTVNLSGWSISDDITVSRKWVFPAIVLGSEEFLILWASDKDSSDPTGDLHLNFKITADGETIVLSDSSGGISDVFPAVTMGTDESVGRLPDGGEIGPLSVATPGWTNNSAEFDRQVAKPEFSVTPGYHAVPVSLEITHPDGAEVRFTLDGSVPTRESMLYTQPISMGMFSSTAVRARAFRDEWYPSKIVSGTYFIPRTTYVRRNLPVISLITDPFNLYDHQTGIYVEGPNYDGSNFRTANYGMHGDEWERPMHVEFFETDGTTAFSHDGGIRTHGNVSRTAPNKSFRLYARDRYGPKRFRHRLFPEKDIDEFRKFILRNGGTSYPRSVVTDAVSQRIVRHMGFDTQHSRHAAVYLNGEYWGLYNIRDYQDDYHIHEHYDVDRDQIDMLEFYKFGPETIVLTGDSLHWTALTEYIETHDLADDANYRYVQTQVDTRNMMRYWVAESYVANRDWPGKNVKWWRKKVPYDSTAPPGHDGRWRWLLVDTDYGFNGPNGDTYAANMFDHALDPDGRAWSNGPWSSLLMRSLLRNATFRNEMIDCFLDHMNTTFKTDRMIAVIDSFEQVLEREMAKRVDRWHKPPAMSTWHDGIESMRLFARRRTSYHLSHMQSYFGLSSTTRLIVSATGGRVRVNSILIDSTTPGVSAKPYPWIGTYFAYRPVRLEAIPDTGYVFDHWSTGMTTEKTTIILMGTTYVTAVFRPTNVGVDEMPVPRQVTLAPNTPNPFNPVTTLRYSLPSQTDIRLTIHNVSGQLVRVMDKGTRSAGTHTIAWDGRDSHGRQVASGVYLTRLVTPDTRVVRRMTLVR